MRTDTGCLISKTHAVEQINPNKLVTVGKLIYIELFTNKNMSIIERLKYLFDKKISISEIVFPKETYWKGKRIITTKHFLKELQDNYGKNSYLFEDILADGKHVKESKVKTVVTKPTTDGVWELVYAEYEDSIYLIHLKLRRK